MRIAGATRWHMKFFDKTPRPDASWRTGYAGNADELRALPGASAFALSLTQGLCPAYRRLKRTAGDRISVLAAEGCVPPSGPLSLLGSWDFRVGFPCASISTGPWPIFLGPRILLNGRFRRLEP